MFRLIVNRIKGNLISIPFSTVRLKTTKNPDQRRIEHEKLCRNEMQLQFLSGDHCPDPKTLSEAQMKYIFNLPSRHQRKRHLKYLYNKEVNTIIKTEANSLRKEILEDVHTKLKNERLENKHIVYGLGHNSLLLRVNRRAINRMNNLRLLHAKLFGQKLIIDCSFDNQMNDREIRNVVWNLEQAYTANREHIRPLDLHLFGGNSRNISIDRICRRIPSLTSRKSAVKIYYECYSQMFPKDRLVILTPDSNVDLVYDFNDIYVVGGIVDRGHSTPLMMAKAKHLGLRTARFPLRKNAR